MKTDRVKERMEEMNITEIQKIVSAELDYYWNVATSNPCYNYDYAREDFLKLVKELELKYNIEIDTLSYKIKEKGEN